MKGKTHYFVLMLLIGCISCKSNKVIGNGSESMNNRIKLEQINLNERNSLLLLISKEAIKTFGPAYLPYLTNPVITKGKTRPDAKERKFRNRDFYSVAYYYDTTKIRMEYGHSAKVLIWENNARPASVFFGNGLGKHIYDEVGKQILERVLFPFKKTSIDSIVLPKEYIDFKKVPIQDINLLRRYPLKN